MTPQHTLVFSVCISTSMAEILQPFIAALKFEDGVTFCMEPLRPDLHLAGGGKFTVGNNIEYVLMSGGLVWFLCHTASLTLTYFLQNKGLQASLQKAYVSVSGSQKGFFHLQIKAWVT